MRQPDNEPLLFDLPLDRPARGEEPEEMERERPGARREPAPRGGGAARHQPPAALAESQLAARQRQRAKQAEDAGLFEARSSVPLPAAAGRSVQAATAAALPAPAEEESAARAGIGRRVASGAADLLVHVAVGVVALAGCRYLGVTPDVRDWPAIAIFLLSFSFLYTVVPLAFWGHTLGMTWAGLTSQSSDGEALSFDQTARRWLGMLLTLAALGLPLLLALSGRSLVDRISDSSTSHAT
jgi:uncharacterized RDD family membrane protein YckC